MNKSRKRVLISGGGIAGLAAAWWLERAGAQVTIVEKAHAFEPLGHYIGLKSHGVHTVSRMGLLEACRARELTLSGLTAYTHSGRPLRDADTTLLARNVAGLVLFRRADLHAALYAAVKPYTELRFGAVVDEIHDAGDHMEVCSSAGTERFDLVIGADGIHSRTRKLLFGDVGVHSLAGHYFALSANFPHDLTPGKLAAYFGRGQFVALIPGDTNQLSGLIYHANTCGIPPARHDAAGTRAFLRQAYAHFPAEVRRLLEALDERSFVFSDEVAMVTLDSITRGRSALLGDAAHCPTFMSGMGASLALQGAQALGRALYDHGDDIAAALAAYERAISDVARGYQRSARHARRLLLSDSRLLTVGRDALLRWTPDWALAMTTQRFYQATSLVHQ